MCVYVCVTCLHAAPPSGPPQYSSIFGSRLSSSSTPARYEKKKNTHTKHFLHLKFKVKVIFFIFLLFLSSPGVDSVSSSQTFGSKYRARTPLILFCWPVLRLYSGFIKPSRTRTPPAPPLDLDSEHSVKQQECPLLTRHTQGRLSPCLLSPPPPPPCVSLCVSGFPNPFSSSAGSASQQPVALSPSNPFSTASGGKLHVWVGAFHRFNTSCCHFIPPLI